MTIATFGMNPAGLAIVEEVALIVVSENWIPYETVPEKRLVDGLARLREKSVKGLRFDLQPDHPIANALLQNRPRADCTLCRSGRSRRELRSVARRNDRRASRDRLLGMAGRRKRYAAATALNVGGISVAASVCLRPGPAFS